MEEQLIKLADFGTVGIIAAVLIYDVFYLQKKLIQIIENNTQAITSLKDHCQNKNAER